MTAQRLAHDSHLGARAVLSPEATVTLHDPAAEPLSLEHATVQYLFVTGVELPGHDKDRRTTRKPKLTLEGRAQFLVGHVDLGRKRGLRAVRDGLEHCIGVLAGDHLQTATNRLAETDRPDESDRDPALTDPSPEPPGVVDDGLYVEMWRAGDNFDAVADLALGEGSVVLTHHGTPQLVLLAWDEHCEQRERDAQVRAAYWSVVRAGARSSRPPGSAAPSPDTTPAAPHPDHAGSGHDQ